jgi:hypothetical protein
MNLETIEPETKDVAELKNIIAKLEKEIEMSKLKLNE